MGATVAVGSGSYADTVRVNNPHAGNDVAVEIGERPGTYSISIRKPGYVDWDVSGLLIPPAPAPCEGNPGARVAFEAALQPAR